MSLPSEFPPLYISPPNPDLADPIETSPFGDKLLHSNFDTAYGFNPNLPFFSNKPPKSAEKPQVIADALLQFHLDKADCCEEELIEEVLDLMDQADSSEEALTEEVVDLLDEKITNALTTGLDLVDEIFDCPTSDKQIDSIAGCLSFCVYNALKELDADETVCKEAHHAVKAEIQTILMHPTKSKEAIYNDILTLIPSLVVDL